MTILKAVARSSQALKKRLDVNQKYSTKDLNQWIFGLFSLKADAKVLDLCCGRGDQTLRFAKQCPRGVVYALDVAKESLEFIKRQRRRNIRVVLKDMDRLSASSFRKNYFDLIHCAYGLYYSKKPKVLIKLLHSFLKPGGKLIIAGPIAGTNKEIFSLMTKVYKIDPSILSSVREFMPNTVFPQVKKLFTKVKKFIFNNKVVCPKLDELMCWVRSSTHYKAQYDRQLQELLNKYFMKHRKFAVSKKAMAVVGTK